MPSKYDWKALKSEFLVSNDQTVKGFCIRKGLSDPSTNAFIAKMVTGWAGEKKEIGEKAMEKYAQQVSEGMFEDLKSVRLKIAKIGVDLQEKGLKALIDLKPKTSEDARKLIETGVKIQQQALGITDKVVQDNQQTVNIIVSKFEDLLQGEDEKGLLELLGTIRRKRLDSSRKPLEAEDGQPVGGEGEGVSNVGETSVENIEGQPS